MKNQKINILGLIILFFLLISLGSCKSGSNLTGKEWIQKEQQYRNYDAAMKRLEKADKELKKELKKEAKKKN